MSLRTVLKPVNAIFGGFGFIGNIADARIVKYHNSNFGPHLKRAQETGEDLGASFYGKWVVHSLVTIPDRFVTLAKELTKVPGGCMVWSWTLNDYLLVFQYLVKLCFTFLLFKMIGRESIAPLVPTDSIFFNHDEKLDTNTDRAQSIKGATEWAAGFRDLLC